MGKIRAAFATDDGMSFMNLHFGRVKCYRTSGIDEASLLFVK